MSSLICKVFAFVLVLSIGLKGQISAQTVNPPIVSSPVNLCYGITSSPLTATGSNLQWVSPISSSVGGTSPLTSYSSYIASDDNNNKRTIITTSVANVKITAIDYTITAYQQVSGLQLVIRNASGTEVGASSTVTSSPSQASQRTITNLFDCTLPTAGTYYIGIKAGSGNVGNVNFSTTIGNAPLTITGVTNSRRFFTNIKYTYNESTTSAPTPSTANVGTMKYYVTQTVNGQTSNPAEITVNINSTAPPTVSSPISICQGNSAPELTATGTNLLWTAAIASRVGTAYEYNSNGGHIQIGTARTTFKTTRANVMINSLEFYKQQWNSMNDIEIGIYDASGTLLTTAPKFSKGGTSTVEKIQLDFNYNLPAAGEYSIGIVSGSGKFCYGSATYPQTESAGILSITANTFPGNMFNINFSTTTVGASSTPTPSTAIAGTYYYYVTQTVNGCMSPPSVVTVNIYGITSTTLGVGCPNNSIKLKATASSGYTLSWFDVASGGSSLGSGTEFNTPNLTVNKTYYVQATNGSCTSNRVPVQAIIGGYTWTGSAGTSSTASGSWSSCNGGIPSAGSSVYIPSGTPILSADLTIDHLSIDANAKLDLGGRTLRVKSISGEGLIKGSGTSKLIIDATQDMVLRMDQTTDGSTNLLEALTINNNSKTIVVGNALIIKGGLDITGSCVLNSNGNLTLQSTENSNANVGPLTNGGSIIGNVKVQAFMKGANIANRNFRTITPPVYDVSSQEKGYGIAGYKTLMYVTGPGGEANGFDASPNNGHTIKYYYEPRKNAQNQYLYPANATTEYIKQATGVYFYFRGKKDNTAGNKFVKVGNAYGTPEDVTMEYYGVINSGNISPAITYTNHAGESSSNGFNLIGNPYPSVIDWDSPGILKTNIDATIWVQRQNGTFAVYKPDASTNGGSRYLLPGQGFFIKATGASPSITFTEASKATAATIPARLLHVRENPLSLAANFGGTMHTTSVKPVDRFNLTMIKDEYATDETVVVLKNGTSTTFDSEDISYQGEGPVTFTTITPDSKYLAINYQPETTEKNEIALYTTAAESGAYSIKLSSVSGLDQTSLFLKDSYTNQLIDLQSQDSYNFTIDKTKSASFGNRFAVVMIPETVLPVKLKGLSASVVNNSTALEWATISELGTAYFEVQQSVDGKEFYTIGKVLPQGAGKSYSFTDEKPANGINYYRLKVSDTDGTYAYSTVAQVNFDVTSVKQFSVYPNPVNSMLKVNAASKNLKIQLFDLSGKKVLEGTGIELATSGLSKGMYIVEIRTDANTLLGTTKVMKD